MRCPVAIQAIYVLVHQGVSTEAEAERLARVHLPPERDRGKRAA